MVHKCTTNDLRVYKILQCMCITLLDPIDNIIYVVVLLFAICKFPYDSLDKNLMIFIVIKDEIKVPWQKVTHTYHECWCVFVV